MKTLRTFWMREPGNCGDVLTPHLLNGFGYFAEWAPHTEADYIFTGSIATWARPGAVVVGSGIGAVTDRPDPAATYLAVRGPRTRAAVIAAGGTCPEIYGDPALLMPHVYDRRVPTHNVPAFFAHYCDLEDPALNGWPVINPLGDPLVAIDAMRQFSPIFSSSLHGIILAHAYGIPAAWVKLSDKLFGDGVKFADYADSVGITLTPYTRLEDAVPVLPDKIPSRTIFHIFKDLSPVKFS